MIEVAQHDVRDGKPLVLRPGDFLYADVPYGTGRKFEHYDDKAPAAMEVQRAVVAAAEQFLVPGGLCAVQCDHHLNWYVRAILEASALVFVNEIIWAYNSGGAGQKHLPQKHDTIYVFAKPGWPYTFNVLREPYPRDYGQREGFHPDGRMITSVWNIPILSTTSTERTGYSTEKPPALLERLLSVYTRAGDLVWDPCCGSGAMGVAALRTGRTAYLSDIHPVAVETTQHRVQPTIAGRRQLRP